MDVARIQNGVNDFLQIFSLVFGEDLVQFLVSRHAIVGLVEFQVMDAVINGCIGIIN
jgi:hypothetical protein